MQSIKVVNPILLGYVALIFSFGLGLLISRDFNSALVTGIITLLASYAGAIIADRRRIKQEKQLRVALQSQFEALEGQHFKLQQSLAAATVARQQLEGRIHALQAERHQLLGRVADLHTQRSELCEELSAFQNQKQQLEADTYILQTQVQQLERQQAELNQTYRAKATQIQQAETRSNRVQTELEARQRQILDQQNDQAQLQKDIAALEQRKQHLGGEAYDLQTQIQVLEQRWEELAQALSRSQAQKQEAEASLIPLQSELEQLQARVVQKQQQQEQLNQELATLAQRKQHLETETRTLQIRIQADENQGTELAQTVTKPLRRQLSNLLPEEWIEWLEFAQQLNDDEQKTFQVILERDEAALKKIADERSAMPQVLINSINQHTLERFGDPVFVNSEKSLCPQVTEDYVPILTEPITLYFKDLLTCQDRLMSEKSGQLLK